MSTIEHHSKYGSTHIQFQTIHQKDSFRFNINNIVRIVLFITQLMIYHIIFFFTLQLKNILQMKLPSSSQIIVKYQQNGKKQVVFCCFQNHPYLIDQQYQLQKLKTFGTHSYYIAAKDLQRNQQISIKQIEHIFDEPYKARSVLRMIKLLKFLKHQNLINLNGIMSIEAEKKDSYNNILLCVDPITYTLHQLIDSKQITLTEKMIKFILYQLLSGLNYMHSAGILHCDLTPGNIFLNKKLQLKINTLNQNYRRENQQEHEYYIISRPYRAPELYFGHRVVSKANDIWSVGQILALMIGKVNFFKGVDFINCIKNMCSILGKPNIDLFKLENPQQAQIWTKLLSSIPDTNRIDWKTMFPNVSQIALDLLDRILVYDPKKRPTAEQCLNHPFFKQYKGSPRKVCLNLFDSSFEATQMTIQCFRNRIYNEVKQFFGEQPQKEKKQGFDKDRIYKKIKLQ